MTGLSSSQPDSSSSESVSASGSQSGADQTGTPSASDWNLIVVNRDNPLPDDFSVELETITSQSVQKIAQVLQQQVESVLDKGVSVDDLYDIYGWLDDIDATLDMVSRLDFTEEGRIRAVMDEAYLSGRLRSAFGEMAGQYGLLAAACAVGCGIVALAPRGLARWKRRRGAHTANRGASGYAAG